MHRRHIGAANHFHHRFVAFDHFMEKLRIVLGYQHNRAKADNKGEDVEVADKAGGHKHRFTRLLGIGHGKEAHQNMRQTGRTEHQRQP